MEKNKMKKPLNIMGYILCGLQLTMSVLMLILCVRFGAFPDTYLIVGETVLVLITALQIFLHKWISWGIVSKFVSILLCGAMGLGCIYIKATDDTLDAVSGVDTEVNTINIYVLADDPAATLKDTTGYAYGILQNLDRENTDAAMNEISTELGTKVAPSEYGRVTEMVDALYSYESRAIVLNGAYLNMVTESEGYADFGSRVKLVGSIDITTLLKGSEEEEQPTDDNIFTVYISGIDSDGAPNIKGNSDVNILMTVNVTTRQILMVSTPRDYYVPLSISGGECDKLTHAGCYGVDVSMDTLEMLYDVNVDYYLKVNFTGFVEIIDVLGGIDVHSDYDFTTDNYSFHQGTNSLNGKQALEFARERHSFSEGDRQRGANQMEVIKAVINKMATSDALKNYTSILDKLSDSMATDAPSDFITDLVKLQLADMKGWDIVSYGVNGTDSQQMTYSLSSPAYVMLPDQSTVDIAKDLFDKIYAGEIVEPQ